MNRREAETHRIADCRLPIDDCRQSPVAEKESQSSVVNHQSSISRRDSELLAALRTVTAVLREIFDESPYARFLARTGRASSGAAYAAFLQEKSGGRPRPRCC